MENLKIRKSIDIAAPREQVWEAIVNNQLNRIWMAEFSEGSYTETDWQEDSHVAFKDKSNCGMVGKIITSKPAEALVIEFDGIILEGKEDFESEEARQVKGGRETYLLTERNGTTTLAIESDMSEEYFEVMSKAWDQALQQLKALAVSQPEKVK